MSSAEVPSATRTTAGEKLARRAGPQQNDGPVRHEGLKDLVHQEFQQLVDGDVAQKLDRQLVDHAQRLDQLRELLRRKARIGLGRFAQQLGGGLQDRVVERVVAGELVDPDAGRGFRFDLERHASDRDPVSRLERKQGREPIAVDERPVAGAHVLDREAAVSVPDDPRVLPGEHLVGDRQVVHRRTADRRDGPVEQELLRRHPGSGQVEVKHEQTSVGF